MKLIRTALTPLVLSALGFVTVAAHADGMEHIEVLSSTSNFYQSSLKLIEVQHIDPQQAQGSPLQLSELLAQEPTISLNGQGGMMQMYSMRGFSRWRVQTLVEGIPIYGDRRAGSAAEFIDPALIRQVQVIPGAASTYYGSGAMGGAVDIKLNRVEAQQLDAQWQSNNQAQHLAWQGSKEGISWGLSTRTADEGESADGNSIYNGYENHNVFLSADLELPYLTRAWVLYSEGNNLGKASASPLSKKRTLYPRNDHLLAKAEFDFDQIYADVYVHNAHLDTYIERPNKRINSLSNSSLDYGAALYGYQYFGDWEGKWRLSFDARTQVQATENELDLASGLTSSDTVLDASQYQGALVYDATRSLDNIDLLLGGRLDYSKTKAQQGSRNDTNVSGFAGISWALTPELAAKFITSTAFRQPALTESYFFGEPPRGRVEGNLDLEPEQSLGFEAKLSYQQSDFNWSLSAFSQHIDDYIERIDIDADTRRYINVGSGKIKGLAYKAAFQVTDNFSLGLGGQWLNGEDEQGRPLADIGAGEHKLTSTYQGDRWQWDLGVTLRSAKDEVGPSELPLPSHTLLSTKLTYQLNERTKVRLWLDNAGDRLYRVSADDSAPYAPGRNVGIAISYQF
ncbi:TonB-dependent receptor [Pseudoalteromonas sp. T1lg10]|uniref:TonB-dependent receptor n=1 Tax=Pseudoalteromonas sp. T1lg10 TaxID=2077093 RepID=UPI000CF5E286|nr:TonB-dependent receptor [Pseudoalteromonas sp. T1lg10]